VPGLVLLFGLTIVLLANFKTRFRTGLQLRAIGLMASLLLLLSTVVGCGTGATALGNGSAVAGKGSGGGSGTGGSGSTKTATSISSLTVNPSSVVAGSSASATVTLNAPAPPPGGAQVTLTSSNAAVASVPGSVTFAAGQIYVNFAVATGNVSSDTSVLISASYNNTTASVLLSVQAPGTPTPPTPISISIHPSSASLVAGASQQFTATVTGSTNTSVSWTATGGNISNTGLFTAPNVSASTIVSVIATSQANPSVATTAQVTVTPASTPPPPGGGSYSGSGPVASWNAYLVLGPDNRYHQGIEIYNSHGAYPVIGYSYVGPGCTNLGDTFNDYWQPIGNGVWAFLNQPNLVYVQWVWYNNATDRQILQQTPCIDYSGAPIYQ